MTAKATGAATIGWNIRRKGPLPVGGDQNNTHDI
jgi:hypothetical protein